MVETIGQPGTCIRPLEREEILIALDNVLDNRNRELKRIETELTRKKIIRPEDKFKHPVIHIFEDLIERAQIVKDRVINTPEC